MGGGVSQPCDVKSNKLKFFVKLEDGSWRAYDDGIQDTLGVAFLKGDGEVTHDETGLTFDFIRMVESNLMGGLRNIKCEYCGENPPKRPIPKYNVEDMDIFESHTLSYLVLNQLQLLDVYNKIDVDRNNSLTKNEVHNFFVNEIWGGMPFSLTSFIFESMESNGELGRISFESFSHAATEELKRVQAFEQMRSPSQFGYRVNSKYSAALKQSRSAIAHHEKRKDKRFRPPRIKTRNSSGSETHNYGLNKLISPKSAVETGVDFGVQSNPSNTYENSPQYSPMNWIKQKWYWRDSGHSKLTRQYSAELYSLLHQLLMVKSHLSRNHHVEGEVKLEHMRRRQLEQFEEELLTGKVCELEALLEVQLQAAIQEEEASLKQCKINLSTIRHSIVEVTKRHAAALSKVSICDEQTSNVNSWEVEDCDALLFQLKRDEANAQDLLSQRLKVADEDESETALDILEVTDQLIDSSRLLAQACVDVRILEINKAVNDGRRELRAQKLSHKLHRGKSDVEQDSKMEENELRRVFESKQEEQEMYHENVQNLEYLIKKYNADIETISTDYFDLPTLRSKVALFFNKYEAKIAGGLGVKQKGDVGYYRFMDSSLGRVLFNQHGTVTPEFRSYAIEIDRFKERDDRPAWGGESTRHTLYNIKSLSLYVGALLTAIFSQWSKSPSNIRIKARDSMRYVVFDSETRLVGFRSLLREDWASLYKNAVHGTDEDKFKLKQAQDNAAMRYKLSKPLLSSDPNQQVEFFVSHNWCNDNASHRWGVLLQLSDLFYKRFGYLPRFWIDRFCIDQSKQDEIALKTSLLPATIMSCNFVLVLQSPQYMGCTRGGALPSLWCIVEFFTLCSLAPADNPTANLLWIPLFETKNVPPQLDLLHGRVYCYSDEDKARLLSQLASCPGGLVEVQRSMAAVWPVLFKKSYAKWALLSQCARDNNYEKVKKRLEGGVSVDLPFDWSPSSSLSTIVRVAAAMLHERWRDSRTSTVNGIITRGGPRWKPISEKEFNKWFVEELHEDMVRSNVSTTVDEEGNERAVIQREIDIDQPFWLLSPTWQLENEKQARAAFDILYSKPESGMEVWADAVHKSWLARRMEENGGVLPQWVIDADQHLPYEELSEVEKEKDRVVVHDLAYLLDKGSKVPRIEYGVYQPLQSAVFQYLKSMKGMSIPLSPTRMDKSQSASTSRRMQSFRRASSMDNVKSCLDDDQSIIKLLLDAGADPLDAINQPIIGDTDIDDQIVFKLLEDLLLPLFIHPPHVLSLMYNHLTTDGALRLLRFQSFINDSYKKGESQAPLISLCGLTPEVIQANWPRDLDDSGDRVSSRNSQDNTEKETAIETTKTTNGSTDMLDSSKIATRRSLILSRTAIERYQATFQTHLRSTSFLLLLTELTSMPHVSTLTCLDLSHNINLEADISTLAVLKGIKRINLTSCRNVTGELGKFISSCNKLSHVELASTGISGELPVIGEWLPHLEVFDLSDSKVVGKLDAFKGAHKLKYLKLNQAREVSGSLFPGLERCFSLKELHLSCTKIEGSLQNTGKELPRLEVINIQHCKNITGSMVHLSECSNIKEINISHTAVSGGPTIPIVFRKQCNELKKVEALNCPRFEVCHDFDELEVPLGKDGRPLSLFKQFEQMKDFECNYFTF